MSGHFYSAPLPLRLKPRRLRLRLRLASSTSPLASFTAPLLLLLIHSSPTRPHSSFTAPTRPHSSRTVRVHALLPSRSAEHLPSARMVLPPTAGKSAQWVLDEMKASWARVRAGASDTLDAPSTALDAPITASNMPSTAPTAGLPQPSRAASAAPNGRPNGRYEAVADHLIVSVRKVAPQGGGRRGEHAANAPRTAPCHTAHPRTTHLPRILANPLATAPRTTRLPRILANPLATHPRKPACHSPLHAPSHTPQSL